MYVGMWWNRTVVSNVIFVQDPAGTLTGYICDPYTSNAEAILVGETQDLVPERLIDFL